jgi:TonB family protein
VGHGLGLGRIPFSKSYSPYTPIERRRRGKRSSTVGPLKLKAARSDFSSDGRTVAKKDSGADRNDSSILPDDLAPVELAFVIAADQERIQRSLAVSFGSHIVVAGIIVFLISLAPVREYEVVESIAKNYTGIVWIPEDGLGGGGGGGGNESLETPQVAEVEGTDEADLDIPIEERPELIEPEPEEIEEIVTQAVSISALTAASSVETRTGVLEGLRAASSDSQGIGTDNGAGTGEGGGIGPGVGDGLGPGEGGGTGGGVFRPGNDVAPPRVLREIRPEYTSEAMRARIQGTVWLDVVVLPDGTVGDVTVSKSLDNVFGLDSQAVAAARQWLFSPGMRLGEPVAVLVTLELFFNLR